MNLANQPAQLFPLLLPLLLIFCLSSRRDLLLSLLLFVFASPQALFFLVKPFQQELIRNSARKPNKNKALASEIIFRKVAY